jgi:hypothetical protein
VFGVGLLLTASYYDAYRRLLTALGVPSAINFVSYADVFLRSSTLMYALVWVLLAMTGNMPAYDEPSETALIFYVVFNISLLLYTTERLVGRYRLEDGVTQWEDHAERFFSSLINRAPFTGPFSGLLASLVVASLSAAVSTATYFCVAILGTEENAFATVFLAFAFASEIIYTVARLGRFKAISEQSTAARTAASLHTLFTTSFSTPVTILYFVAHSWDRL